MNAVADLTTIRDLDLLIGVARYHVLYDNADGVLKGYLWTRQEVCVRFESPSCLLWIPLEWVTVTDPETGRVVA